ncbi:MAG: NAD-dependent DNA ligase LigA, partial [Myxococcales bacterium]|nr:NAD-dependent DNA ligase LigA [Myxococcales bacterium]
MPSKSALEEIRALRERIDEANHRYYVLAQPTISDAEYDRLFRRLVELEEAHPELADPSSPTQRVGAAPLDTLEKATHAVPMMSLDNAFDDGELRDFHGRVTRGLERETDIAYMTEPKMDGVAMELVYEDGALTVASTRGDGLVGENVTANARTI